MAGEGKKKTKTGYIKGEADMKNACSCRDGICLRVPVCVKRDVKEL